MCKTKYPAGSEWRQWDLHVHTPFSVLNNGFGSDFNAYAKSLFEKALHDEIAVIGITDYFLIDGYKQLREIQQDRDRLSSLIGDEAAPKAQKILLLPNIEFRISVVINNNRVNFHVLFSDTIPPETIEEDFLRDLKFTSESMPGRSDEKWSLTHSNLEALGSKLKEHHGNFRDKSDLYVGINNAVIAHETITEVLERQQGRFKDKYLIVVPADEDLSECSWDGQAHLTRKVLLQKAHMFFSANPGTREFGLGLRHATKQEFLNEFKSLKPCVHGSDAHSHDALFIPEKDRLLWIKADPTFLGLRRLLHEPRGRIHIGPRPPHLGYVRENSTKYMSSISFERTEQANSEEVWFSGTVPLNTGLIAIIGNKGSGKSALADILALMSDSGASLHFSFLNGKRFLRGNTRLGDKFRGTLSWESGRRISRPLSERMNPNTPELVKYIPQNYLETICSDLKRLGESDFYRELMEVIFSHVSDADRLNKETLPELVDYLIAEKEDAVAQLILELRSQNEEIIALEDQLTREYRSSLEAKLSERFAELEAHKAAKPPEVEEPIQDPKHQAAVTQELGTLAEQVESLDTQITDVRAESKVAALRVAAADKLATRMDNLEKQFQNFHTESESDAKLLGLATKELVTLEMDRQSLSRAKVDAEEQRHRLEALLDPDVATSLLVEREKLSEKATLARSKLDEPNRRYQEYLHELSKWQTRHSGIEGSATEPDSVKGLQAKIATLDRFPSELRERKAKRLSLARKIYEAKERLLEDYRRLYRPVQEFISKHSISKNHGVLEFSASIGIEGLEDGLLAMINHGRRGSFQGVQEGRKMLNELVSSSDFSSESGVETFLACVQDLLEYDKQDGGNKPVRLRDQLVQNVSPQMVYDFLYGLSYLTPRFELRWQGKPLDQLSPGERGNLLLVFYLLIDKRTVPLIIDQPEENLDNQTIATMLVPAIKDAKKRRQIIIVTHNPNLAVVCDADQVIHASTDKTDGNRVTYTSGAIEDPYITQLIVDVLEGTKPAFDLRGGQYGILEGST